MMLLKIIERQQGDSDAVTIAGMICGTIIVIAISYFLTKED